MAYDIIIKMFQKFFFKESFLALFLVLALTYAPLVQAGGVVNAVVNAVIVVGNAIADFSVAAANFTANLVVAGGELVAGVFQCAGTGGTDCGILGQAVCRLSDPTQPVTNLNCPEGGILTIGTGVSDVSACLVSADLTFYDNAGPHSAGEQNSTVQIFRFTLPQTERYYPVGGLTDEQAQNAAVMNWMATLDNQVGNGLISPYEFKENSYFMLNAATATPLAEVPYGNFCDASGVCKIRDQSLPKDAYIAYIARTKANYDFIIPNEDKVVYDVQVTCPAGTTQTTSWNGTISCQNNWGGSVPPVYYLGYNGGRIPVTQEKLPDYPYNPTGKWYITDAKGNKIYSNSIPPLYEQNNYRYYKFEFKESEKPQDFELEFPIQAKCPAGTNQVINFGGTMSCTSFQWAYYQNIPPNYSLNYNSGQIPVTAETRQNYPYATERFYFTDSKGKKMFSGARADIFAKLIVQAFCPDGYTYDGRSKCYNNQKQPYQVEPTYYLNEPVFKMNDKKLNAPLLVSHDIAGTCPQGTQTTADGRCYYPWGGYVDPPPTHVNYNGGKVPLASYLERYTQYSPDSSGNCLAGDVKNYLGTCSAQFARASIKDSAGNLIQAVAKPGAQYPDKYTQLEFPLQEGTPDSQKFTANYPTLFTSSNYSSYNPITEFYLSGYNGGKLFAGLVYNINTANNYGNINGLHFYLNGNKYYYPSSVGYYSYYNYFYNLPTEFSIAVDEYSGAAPEIAVRRDGKFLSAKSGEPVTDTYIGSPFSLITGNGILGPFKPLADVACAPLISAPTVISQTCNSVTLESKELKPLNVLRRVKGSVDGFALVRQFDFSSGSTFTDTNLQPHLTYEYAFALPTAPLDAAIPVERIAEAYTFCRPKCGFLTTAKDVVELGETSLDWKCEADTVPISCQIQSDDAKAGTLSSLSSQGSVSISPSQDSRYLLTCTNVDGSVTAQPLRVNVFQPGIKEVKP